MLVIVGLFFGGGNNEPYNGKWNPKYTDVLLYWMYALFFITLVVIFFFVIVQFIGNFKADAKKALVGLGILILFGILLLGTYSIGDGTPITTLAKPDIEAYNTPFWLKLTDMFLYTIYIIGILTILGVIVGSVKRIFEK
jgi:small-conductance mechanosensitive channel